MTRHENMINIELLFKAKIMNAILDQDLVVDVDDQIRLLNDICKDLKDEMIRQEIENTKERDLS